MAEVAVDTYLKGKHTSRSGVLRDRDAKIRVAGLLLRWAQRVKLDARRFLLWWRFAVEMVPLNVHGST